VAVRLEVMPQWLFKFYMEARRRDMAEHEAKLARMRQEWKKNKMPRQ
jgi:hypothetical protein